jgi:uncharacterized protein YecT (DUF1311 family)
MPSSKGNFAHLAQIALSLGRTKRTMNAGCLLLVLSQGMAGSALGASFDCDKATTGVEKRICASARLSMLDQALADAYRLGLRDAKDEAAFRQDQRRWLANVRDRCQDDNCLARAYEDRLRVLGGTGHVSDVNTHGKRYPPYPEVWQFRAPPKDEPIKDLWQIRLLPNGDLRVEYTACCGAQPYKAMSFFEHKQLSTDQPDLAGERTGTLHPGLVQTIKTSTGLEITTQGTGTGMFQGCYDGLSANVAVYQDAPERRLVSEKMLLYLFPRPQQHVSPEHCNETRSFTYWAESIGGELYPLEDGTFLVIDHKHNLIIRLDGNLNTQSTLLNDRLFIIDPKEFGRWAEPGDYGDRADDNGIDFGRLHRDLRDWLLSKRKEARK